MCGHCGCGNVASVALVGSPDEEHKHGEHRHGEHEHVHADGTRHRHAHDDAHQHHHHDGAGGSIVELQTRVLAKNDALAATNRAWFAGREILTINLMSSPGAGKTTLLERTIRDLSAEQKICVLEGDQATSLDGDRIRATGVPVAQVNTGTGCHLDSDMVARGLAELRPPPGSLLLIENVGNLVCPAMFDLGEWAKVVILSVTEGDDKPLKYPHMFRAASIMLISKLDLLPYVDFELDRVIANARAVNPDIEVLSLSARTGEGLPAWYDWLRRATKEVGQSAFTVGQAEQQGSDRGW